MKQAPIPLAVRVRLCWPHWLAAGLTGMAICQWLGEFGREPDVGWLLASLLGIAVHTWLSERAHDRMDDLRKLMTTRRDTAV